jgi:UDP-N-acetylmuramate dehydrogenase
VRLTRTTIDEIKALIQGRVQENVPLSRFTSFRIGGPADVVVEPVDRGDLGVLLRHLQGRSIPWIILGAGTNLLFHDAGFRGVVIRMSGFTDYEARSNGSDHALITAGAGLPLPAIIARTCKSGWSGLEPLWGIPASFGGAIVTNAGAGGSCMGDLLQTIVLVTRSGEEILLQRPDIKHTYRCLDLPDASTVVQGTLRLRRGRSDAIDQDLENARERRRTSQPYHESSAGCVFKNPADDKPAGAIIDRLGFKGRSVGGAKVSEVHANFIVNQGNASASDVLELIEEIRDSVRNRENIDLELEIRVVGEEAGDV